MIDPANESTEEFSETREHEFQDSHYHDEDPDIVNDELAPPTAKTLPAKKKKRRPPPRPRHYEE